MLILLIILRKLSKLINIANKENRPVALLIKKGTFGKHDSKNTKSQKVHTKREDALRIILDKVNENSIIVSTTGKTSREIFEIRKNRGQAHKKDFLTVGSMGHCSSIALGIALAKPKREVICIDGDGAMLMHLGSLALLSEHHPRNYKHILMNNEAHESVGGQKTAAKNISLSKIAKSLGAKQLFYADSKSSLENILSNFLDCRGPSFLEVKIDIGSRADLGRPTISPIQNKKDFIRFLSE